MEMAGTNRREGVQTEGARIDHGNKAGGCHEGTRLHARRCYGTTSVTVFDTGLVPAPFTATIRTW